MISSTLSHYRIEAELGRGATGIVYKARDTKPDRAVAIKIASYVAEALKAAQAKNIVHRDMAGVDNVVSNYCYSVVSRQGEKALA